MGRSLSKSLAVLLCAIVVPGVASAQNVSVSTIVGVVRDSTGGVLPGVTVEAASPALIEKVRAGQTNEQGLYRIADLRPGTYTVTFTLTGFGTVKREGIELPVNFTATVNGDMRVGTVEETIIVSGASPMVDVQTVTTTTRLTEVLDQIPASHNNFNLATMMPAVVAPPNVQDVGGSKGEFGGHGSVHGGKQADQRYMTDGMMTNGAYGSGNGTGFYVNPAASQDVLVESGSGGSAEYATSGLTLNVIPKDGANKFSGSLFGAYSNSSLEGNNLRSNITSRGLTSTNTTSLIFDSNASLGGPIRRDKLWFFAAGRAAGTDNGFPNYYWNASPNPLLYVPDTSRPGTAQERNKSVQVRLTWQASARNKFSFTGNDQSNCNCPNNEVQNLTPEAVINVARHPNFLIQSTWSSPVTNKILLEAGASLLEYTYRYELQSADSSAAIGVVNSATGITYGLPLVWNINPSPNVSLRGAASYVTGSHLLKAGVYYQWASNGQTLFRSDTETSYTFNGNTPTTITEYASPLATLRIGKDMGLYVQDRWTIRRLTLSPGLRFDFHWSHVPPQSLPADRFLPVRSFGEVDCVPCWKDLDPRLAAAYDLFGDGKTAVSASIGRYVAGEVTAAAAANDPANTVVNSTTRSWTDSNGNLFPDCELTNPALQDNRATGGDLCGKINNGSFGQPVVTTHYDPSVLNGWGKRNYNWRASAEIKHQFGDRFAVTAGYYRAWFGNFLVTNNTATPSSGYDPYCVNVPMNPALPGGGGYQECGLYDQNSSIYGLPANNIVTFASNFGKQTETYNGADLLVNARLPKGGLLQGGLDIGNSTVSQVNAGTVSVSHTNNCFVGGTPIVVTTAVVIQSNSPQQLLYCDVNPPYRVQLKLMGSYALPWRLQASANLQNLPGPDVSATWAAPSSATTLGRPFSSGATVNVPLYAPFQKFEARISQLDLRLAKLFTVRGIKARAEFDVYNALNSNAVLSSIVTYGPLWTRPTEILQARLARFGLNLNF